MRLFRSLTARLVLTAVALVVLVAVLIGAAATAALHSRLTAQLDEQLVGARAGGPGGGPGPDADDHGPNLRAGSLFLLVDPSGTVRVADVNGAYDADQLTSAQVTQLEKLTPDAHVHHLDLTGRGSFRVVASRAQDGTFVVVGLPTRDVDSAVNSLIVWEAALIALGAMLAAAGGTLLVRRQLRPLNQVAATAHEVAALPLASGEIDLSPRVPPELTDERTEVGQVGAALNVLLEHVESSLEARQRSEQQVRQFVADASHELRTPLSTIAGYSELARSRPEDHETTQTALAKVQEESAA